MSYNRALAEASSLRRQRGWNADHIQVTKACGPLNAVFKGFQSHYFIYPI